MVLRRLLLSRQNGATVRPTGTAPELVAAIGSPDALCAISSALPQVGQVGSSTIIGSSRRFLMGGFRSNAAF